ncbi:DUF4124 domain-containing protein [Corallincola platygyrae]|uniref:DUF4124 domain-containing protein n=1 Tax=Corallincola platygyrae TaxID=1193278 RepID=A0ABW4XQX9_9GAMM
MVVKNIALLLCLLGAAAAHAGKLYTWKDANGVVHYSDKPVQGSQAQQIQPKVGTNVIPRLNDGVIQTDKGPKGTASFKVSIRSPQHEATIRDNMGRVSVVGQVEPEIQDGYSYRLKVNDQVLGMSEDEPVFHLMNVNRGEHKLKLELLDQRGKVIASSPVRIIYLHRASVLQAR